MGWDQTAASIADVYEELCSADVTVAQPTA